ncbi:MAG: hypothetical protein AAB453_04595, partial [Patescibacteria group bacterium]
MDTLTHHAYLSTHEPKFAFDLNLFTLRRFELPTLSIEVSRGIIKEASLRPETGKLGKILIIIFDKVSLEAVQALLKVIEEPPAQTKFFLVTPNHASLPLTLLSRVMIWEEIPSRKISDTSEIAKKFLQANPEERLAMIGKMNELGEEALNQLELLVDKKLKSNERARVLNLLIDARGYRREPAMVPKLLWEHLALTLP